MEDTDLQALRQARLAQLQQGASRGGGTRISSHVSGRG